jgi:hypothetical protein
MKKCWSIRIFLFIIISSIFFSNFLAFGYSNEVGITDGLVVNHLYRYYSVDEIVPSRFTFTKRPDQMFHIKWYFGGSWDVGGFWDVNTSTRIVSNQESPAPDNGDHDHSWIWTDVSLDDQILIFNFFSNVDHLFNVTGEAMHGSMAAWILEDNYGSEVWYEKERGILLNGTFKAPATGWQKYWFVSAAVAAGIPGYNYFLLIGAILGCGIILIKYRQRKK